LKDRNGFMWIGTMDGLNRYDGYTIKKYHTNKHDINSLSDNTIEALAEDSLGRIWIGTDDGLNVLYPYNQKTYQVKIKNSLVPFNKIHNLLVDGNLLWICTTEGLLKAEINTDKLEVIEASLQKMKKIGSLNLAGLRVNKIFKTTTGEYCLGLDQKIMVATYNKNKKQFSLKIKDDFFSKNGATHFAEDKSGNIWIANANISAGAGLIRYKISTKELSVFSNNTHPTSLSSNHVSSLSVDKTGNVWIGTIDGGLNKVNSSDVSSKDIVFEKIKTNLYEPNSINSNLIYSLYTANDNSLWVGTIGSGTNILNLNQKQFYHYTTPPLDNDRTANSNFIRAVYLDPYNKLWIGKQNNGLFTFDRHTGIYKKIGFDTQSVFHIGNFDSNSLANSFFEVLG
jgi:ligand-binding sensor domain-containing protein